PAFAAADAVARRSQAIASLGAILLLGEHAVVAGIGAVTVLKAGAAGATAVLTPTTLASHRHILTASLGVCDPSLGFSAARTPIALEEILAITLRSRLAEISVPVVLDAGGRPDLTAALAAIDGPVGGSPAAFGALRRP